METRIIENPATGERIEFIRTTLESDGQHLEFIQTLYRKYAGYIREHVHLDMQEYFAVLEGVAHYRLNGSDRTAHVGEEIIIPPGANHINPYNRQENQRLVLQRLITPALETELFYRKIYELGNRGQLDAYGRASPFQLAVMAAKFNSQTYYTGIPRWVQRAAAQILAKAGSRLGYSHLPEPE